MEVVHAAGVISRIERRLTQLDLPVAVSLWDGTTAAPNREPKVHVKLNSPDAATSLVHPSLGKIAKAYVEGQIDIEGDLRETMRIGEKWVSEHATTYQRRLAVFNWWRHTRPADRKAIQHHYDVGNAFYELWLDRNRVYSCAYFRQPSDSLDLAQEQKLEHICRKLGLAPGQHFLDIGCGWGALIIWAARNHGVKAVGITLSDEQHAFATQRIKELGLEACCKVRLMDYRDLPEDEMYDKIASVGMFEHVGKKNLPVYFAKIHALLKPGGMVLNHGITTNSLQDDALGSDIGKFVDEYVFPGGELVHVSRVINEMAARGLESWDVESLRPHYAMTLWHWVRRLEANAIRASELVGEKRYRVWRIYMAGSAHAFDRGWISVYQILGAKPQADGTLPYPLTREHVYSKH